MKLNELIHNLETSRKSVSEAKIKVAHLLAVNSQDFDKKLSKKFDEAIDAVSKMITSAYTGIKYKIKYPAYNDETPFFMGIIKIKEDHVLNSELSFCAGIVNAASNSIGASGDIKQALDRQTMKQVKLKKGYRDAAVVATKALDSISKSIGKMTFEEAEESSEEK